MLLSGYNRMKVMYILEILKDEGRPLKRADIHRLLDERYQIKDKEKTITYILRDMMDCGLVEANIYQECESQKNKGEKGIKYSGYYIEPEFEEHELLWLIDNTIFSKQLSISKAKALVKKLLTLGSKELAQKVGSVEGMRQFYHTPNPTVSNNIDTLSSAIHETKAVQFIMVDYRLDKSLAPISDYIAVKPVRMVPYNGFYYLIAFDPEICSLRHYRIDKIKDVKIIEQFIDYDVANSKLFIDDYLASHSLMQSGRAVPVQIKIPESQIGLAIDQFGDKFRVLENVDGMATISLSSNENDLYLWALEHGDCVEVVEPQNVRDRIRVTVADMYKTYSCTDIDEYHIALEKTRRQQLHLWDFFKCPNINLNGKVEWHQFSLLRELYFENNHITDFSFTETLKNVRLVSFKNDSVCDFSFLSRLPNFKTLILIETTVSDISYLSNLNILGLKLVKNNYINDYSVLAEMKSLKKLFVDSETLKKINIDELKKANPELKIFLEPDTRPQKL